MMAALHAVDPEAVGLGDEPEVDLVEEVERWVRAFATVDDDMKPGADETAELLRKSMPEAIPSTIVHGDFRVGNTLCEGENVNAIVDWEIWARSDPRVDVAWFLLSSDAGSHPSAIRQVAAMPSGDELLAEYEKAAGFSVADLDVVQGSRALQGRRGNGAPRQERAEAGRPRGVQPDPHPRHDRAVARDARLSHGLGLRDRPRVRGAARVDASASSRRRSSRSISCGRASITRRRRPGSAR